MGGSIIRTKIEITVTDRDDDVSIITVNIYPFGSGPSVTFSEVLDTDQDPEAFEEHIGFMFTSILDAAPGLPTWLQPTEWKDHP